MRGAFAACLLVACGEAAAPRVVGDASALRDTAVAAPSEDARVRAPDRLEAAPEAAPDASNPADRSAPPDAPPVLDAARVGDVPALPDAARPAPDAAPPPPAPPPPLEVRFLGVGGYALRVGDDLILTAPLFTNPPMLTVAFADIEPDGELVGRFLGADFAREARAILVGHAHYDHLLDVPLAWPLTDRALVLGNVSTAHILAGTDVPREAVVAFNDPTRPLVDRRMCPEPDPCTGIAPGNAGEWFEVPGTHVRVRALCSMHPPQILNSIPWALGCVTEDLPALPRRAPEWLDGGTLAWLVDFLDPETGAPRWRIYYQDAPTEAPYGHVPEEILAERRPDLALLNVGNYDAVADQPGAILNHLNPRYAVGGHWEDFFRTRDLATVPIPFLADPAQFDVRALAVLPADPAVPGALVDGEPVEGRYWRPEPGTDFVFSAPGR